MRNFERVMERLTNYFVGAVTWLMYAVYYTLVALAAGVIVWMILN